jgi:hypothetical protein
MLKELFQGVSKFFTNERIVVLVIFLILVWGLLAYSGNKSLRVDTFNGDSFDSDLSGRMNPTPYASNSMQENNSIEQYNNSEDQEEEDEEEESRLGFDVSRAADPSDLLPNDENSQWSALNPNSSNKGDVLMPDLLQAGYHIGLDTIGQTLRNANLQLRSDPVIPKSLVGPWNQSTIEPDLARVPLELGAGL